MTLYTSTVVVPRTALAAWERIGENIALRDRTALPAPGHLGRVVDRRVGPVLPRPSRHPRGVRRHVDRAGVLHRRAAEPRPPRARHRSRRSRSASSPGTLIGLIRWLRELLEPLLEFFRAIPPPVLIPIVMLLIGITDAMKVAVIVSGAVWPVLLNTIEGVRSTDTVMTETARSFAPHPRRAAALPRAAGGEPADHDRRAADACRSR